MIEEIYKHRTGFAYGIYIIRGYNITRLGELFYTLAQPGQNPFFSRCLLMSQKIAG